MLRGWVRRAACAVLLTAVAGVSVHAKDARIKDAPTKDALAYLEGLKGSNERYKAPSELDPRYTIALYVNAATRGPWRQRMWVLQRDGIGGAWRLAIWDRSHWRKAKLADGEAPAYSWPVSTGRYYRGDRFSGPTPTGVFALDERKWRYGRGYTAPGMVHTMYIDFHYSSGRRSGVAFHGTTTWRYRRLGTNASHGCIRMKKKNALAMFNRITGRDGVLDKEDRWGDVPRFWKEQRRSTRWGYTRDGIPHPVEEPAEDAALLEAGAPLAERGLMTAAAAQARAPGAGDTSANGDVLTKVVFRAIAIIFKD
ncbi:MAG: L,D-transpeptidase [Hyphomicrobium sp.]